MPKATLTSRVLKNKTGLEIQVPTFRVSKELLTSTVHYQVVLASSLACFKLPSHKESDVVQYSIDRKLNAFEDLKTKLAALYPGTMLPPINKKSIIVNDQVLRERRASLDHLMKSIASVPKLSTCPPVLEFLGVDSLKAKKFNKGEPLDNKTTASSDDHGEGAGGEEESESADPIVFGDDEDSGNEDLFVDDNVKERVDDLFGNDDDDEEGDDDDDKGRQGNVKIFEGQDLKRGLTEEDEKDFTAVIPDAILTKTEIVQRREVEEDHSDLLQIDDDLDTLMTLNTKTRKSTDEEKGNTSQSAPSKPSLPTKPSTIPPSKPKPQISTKPKSLTSSNKPSIPQKPKSSTSTESEHSTKSKDGPLSLSSTEAGTGASVGAVDCLGQDDIMKYLQDNLDSNAEEVDLFS